jgi:hypothetical protein
LREVIVVAKKASSKTERLDFSGVPKERRQRFRRIPEGEYKAKVMGVRKKWKDNDKSNTPYFAWTLQITDGKYKGTPFIENTSLKKEALFNLRNLIFAASDGKKNVAGRSAVEFNPDSLVGKAVGIVVEDEEWDNKMRSTIGSIIPLSELGEEEDDEEGEEDEDEDEDEADEDEEEDDEGEEEDEDEEEEDLDEVDVEDL